MATLAHFANSEGIRRLPQLKEHQSSQHVPLCAGWELRAGALVRFFQKVVLAMVVLPVFLFTLAHSIGSYGVSSKVRMHSFFSANGLPCV